MTTIKLIYTLRLKNYKGLNPGRSKSPELHDFHIERTFKRESDLQNLCTYLENFSIELIKECPYFEYEFEVIRTVNGVKHYPHIWNTHPKHISYYLIPTLYVYTPHRAVPKNTSLSKSGSINAPKLKGKKLLHEELRIIARQCLNLMGEESISNQIKTFPYCLMDNRFSPGR